MDKLFLFFTINSPLLQLRCRDPLNYKCLDLIVNLDVVKVDQTNTTFEPLPDLAHIVLKTFKSGNIPVPGDHAIPNKACLGLPANKAVCNSTAGDRTDFRHLERFLDQSLAENDLSLDRVEHADHSRLDLFFDLVNDRVEPDIYVFLLRNLGRTGLGPHIKSDDHNRR